MFRTVVLVSLLVLIAALAPYLNGGSLPPAEVRIYNHGQVNTLDPQQMSWSADLRICMNIWDGLARLDPVTLQPVSAAAHIPPTISPDGLVYTFELRDGRWSNGDPIRAADFVRGWRRAIEPGTAADYAFLLTDHIAGLRDYYDWRNQAVALIGRLRDLRNPAPAGHPDCAAALAALREAGDPLPGESGLLDPHDLARRYLALHARQCEPRWRQVGLRAEGERTLIVRLAHPAPYFLELTTLAVFSPVHEGIERLRAGGERGLDDHGLVVYDTQWTKPGYRAPGYDGLVTNGYYTLDDWQFRRRLHFTANPLHPDHDPTAVQSIDVLMYEDANTAFAAYEAGDLDWMVSLSMDYVGALLKQRRHSRPDVYIVPAFGTYFYNFNCRDAVLPDGRVNPFIDRRARRAFALALDRETFCRTVATKENPPSATLIPAGAIPGYPEVAGLPYDPAGANRLLDEAGYTDRSNFPEVVVLYNSGFDHARMAEALAHMWSTTLGVKVLLQAKENKTFADDKARGNFQIARGGWYGDYGDPGTFLDLFVTGNGNNDSGYSNAYYDALLVQAAQCASSSERLAWMARAETLLVTQDLPVVPIYQYTNAQAVKPHLRGIRPNPRELYAWRDIRVAR